MRIVGGQWRGRPLTAPPGRETRPTTDRMRESLFNVLSHGAPGVDFQDARVLDVFAGSGALGLEALSRGAAQATFIETDRKASAAIQQNVGRLGVAREIVVLPLNAARLTGPPLKARAPFDVVFLDAPYDQGLTQPALSGLASRGWLSPGAVVSIEIGARESLALPPGYDALDDRSYGAARLVIAQWGRAN